MKGKSGGMEGKGREKKEQRYVVYNTSQCVGSSLEKKEGAFALVGFFFVSQSVSQYLPNLPNLPISTNFHKFSHVYSSDG